MNLVRLRIHSDRVWNRCDDIPDGHGREHNEVLAAIGDDIWADVQGGQTAGFEGWLVRTGKYREDALSSSGVEPDRILDSVATLA